MLAALAAAGLLAQAAVPGYLLEIPPEPDEAAALRHQAVEKRRAGPAIMVHRGAVAFAPENTLEAYAAAMDYGADGVEIDIRSTADGVLVLFHDDMLDRLTSGTGRLNSYNYCDLLQLELRNLYGTAGPETHIPTLASALVLAGQRNMLLHLDVKEPGLEERIAKMLEEADLWDHVVSINTSNAESLVKDSRYRPLQFKAPGLYQAGTDWSPSGAQEELDKPGHMIIVDDPRVAATRLKRSVPDVRALPDSLRIPCPTPSLGTGSAGRRVLGRLQQLRKMPVHEVAQALLENSRERLDPDVAEVYERIRVQNIEDRALAARELARRGDRSQQVQDALVDTIRNRSLHREWIWHGLDGAAAVEACGRLRLFETVPLLVETFLGEDERLRKVAGQQFLDRPLAWFDWRMKTEILRALGELPCEASERFLMDYVNMSRQEAERFSFAAFDEAARSLMKQSLNRQELEKLLRNSNSLVRAVVIQGCVDHPTPQRREALEKSAPWALTLPAAP